jgi:hypothetical protein
MGLFDRYPVVRRCIVNLKGDATAFEGAVWGRRGGYLVLKNARMLRSEGQKVDVPVDGEVAIPEGNVEFLQVVD